MLRWRCGASVERRHSSAGKSDQTRIEGGCVSGLTILPAKTVTAGQNSGSDDARVRSATGAALSTVIGTTQPICATQSSVSPLHGACFCSGCRVTISAQSVVTGVAWPKAIAVGDASGPSAYADCSPNRPHKAPSRRKKARRLFRTRPMSDDRGRESTESRPQYRATGIGTQALAMPRPHAKQRWSPTPRTGRDGGQYAPIFPHYCFLKPSLRLRKTW